MHENHRNRVRDRFLNEGLDGFEPHQALELLLFYAIPRRDTNELAHRLVERFGSLSGVLDASVPDLMAVEGMGRHSAVLLALMKPLWRLYRRENGRRGPGLSDCGAACGYVSDLFAGSAAESFHLLCLDQSFRLIRPVKLHEGTLDEVSVHPREVVEAALRNGAARVILAHNHPGGPPAPSSADLVCTKRIAAALHPIGIGVVDHIIAGGGDSTFSFALEGRMDGLLRETDAGLSGYRTVK